MRQKSDGSPRERSGQAGLLITGLLVGLLSGLATEKVVATFADREFEIVRAVRDLTCEQYVEDVEASDLVDNALRGMLGGLDRYSRFYARSEIDQLDRETSGEFRGIGIVFRRPITGQVLFVFPESPADRAGIRTGDLFLVVEGRSVAEMVPGELQETIRHAQSEELHLLVQDLEGAKREVVVPLEQVLDPTVRHVRMIDREQGVGYLAILSFSHRTLEEFDRAMDELQRQGLRGLIVDLRANPGGILDAAVHVANRFLPSGAIVRIRTRDETEVKQALPGEARHEHLPLVLLIDEESASASEVLAGCLQDHCAAILVGRPTYGKGTVQTLRRLANDRGVVKLTTAMYYTPSNRSIERWEGSEGGAGITPDLLVEIDEQERAAIYVFLNTYSPPPEVLEQIRAWEEKEGVSLLESPPQDRQLQAAVALLANDSEEGDAERAF